MICHHGFFHHDCGMNPLFYGLPALAISRYMVDEVLDEVDDLRADVHRVAGKVAATQKTRVLVNNWRDHYRQHFL